MFKTLPAKRSVLLPFKLERIMILGLKRNTTARLLEMFSGVCWCEFERGEEIVTFSIELTPLQRELLELLDVDPAAYA